MLIKDITILNREMQPVDHVNVLVENGRFAYVGREELPVYSGTVVDGANKLMMPGFYNTHCHVPMTLIRGFGEGLSLNDWLTKKMFPFEREMNGEDCYYGALLGVMELAAGGCVSISDMYFNIMDVARALDEAGMKANICHGLSSSDPGQRPESLKGWKDTLALLEQSKTGDGRIKVDVGLHAEYTSTEPLVRAAAGLARDHGLALHTHISETRKEHEECRQRHGGLTPVRYFKACGVFENPVLGAHCVWLDEGDREIMAESRATISHCISANLKLASGIPPVAGYMEQGINVVIATDGAAGNNNLNVMEEIHMAALAAKGAFLNPAALPPEQVLKMATVNGAKAQRREDCGVIEAGFKADFVILDMDKPHLTPIHNVAANLVYSAQASDVYMTVIDGNTVYKDGQFPTIDCERVKYECVKRVNRICGRLNGR
ncbi:amidohydrolase [Enterocloster lavalensis]|uniref:amidohydrolase n=1 Tax=Enterocloster lavalensis TaxID=460384 RepID=UPI0026661533|nr:amidohydrolase [Enterocloster lavalensis]